MATYYKLLQENGDLVLQEDGDKILLENLFFDSTTKSLNYAISNFVSINKSLECCVLTTPKTYYDVGDPLVVQSNNINIGVNPDNWYKWAANEFISPTHEIRVRCYRETPHGKIYSSPVDGDVFNVEDYGAVFGDDYSIVWYMELGNNADGFQIELKNTNASDKNGDPISWNYDRYIVIPVEGGVGSILMYECPTGNIITGTAPTTPTDIFIPEQNKSVSYKVTNKNSDTKSLKYTVPNTPAALELSLEYTVTTEQTPIQKSVGYKVTIQESETKSLTYLVTTEQTAIQKNIIYLVTVENELTKSLRYAVTNTPVAKTESLKYTVFSGSTTIEKDIQYAIRRVIQATKGTIYKIRDTNQLTKSLAYQVVSESPLTKSLNYRVTTTDHEISKSLKYNIEGYTRTPGGGVINEDPTFRFVTEKSYFPVGTTQVKFIVAKTSGGYIEGPWITYSLPLVVEGQVVLPDGEYRDVEITGNQGGGRVLEGSPIGPTIFERISAIPKSLSYRIVTVDQISKEINYFVSKAITETKELTYQLRPFPIQKNITYHIRIYPYTKQPSPYSKKTSPYTKLKKVL